MSTRGCLILLCSVALACSDDDKSDGAGDDGSSATTEGTTGSTTDEEPVVIGALGAGTGSLDSVSVEVMANRDDDGVLRPRALAFNPEVDGELWVVNAQRDTVTVIQGAGTSGQTTQTILDPYALHFLDNPSSIAFGKPHHFGTCQESENTYNGSGPPNEFMGPTLWSSDLEIFGTSNPEAVEYLTELFGFPVDLGSHLDMLHESPLCMGIAWDYDNVYWVFDGFHEAIVRYDFAEDHGVGYDDHSDGIIDMHVEGEVDYVPGVPAHMELDADSRLLYLVDPGANRIAVFDTESGEKGDRLRSQEPGVEYHEWYDSNIWTLLEGDAVGLEQLSGLDIHDGLLYVTDTATNTIAVFDLDGTEIDRLTLELEEPGSLMGIAVASPDEIWAVDYNGNHVIRLTPAG